MNAVLQEAVSAHNLPLTVLLGLVALYWVTVLVGVMDFDSLDGFFGLGDHGGDGHEGHSGGEDGGIFHGLLKVIGFTDAPLMFILTVFSLVLWGANVLGNIYFNPDSSGGAASLIFLGAITTAFLLSRLAIRPLRPLMRLMRDTERRAPITGLTGRVRSLQVTNESGQIEVERDGASILLNARVGEGAEPIPRGTEVLVVMEDDAHFYLVRPIYEPESES